MQSDLYHFLLQVHSFLRWIVLLVLLMGIFQSLTARSRPFNSGDRSTGTLLVIFADIMLLVGIYQWVTGPWGLKLIQNMGMSAVMKDATARFFAIEHMAGMLIAIVLIHIGKSFARKTLPDKIKHRRTVLFYTLALLLILISIPWPFRDAVARPWLRLH
jgi:hypothetical protein